MKPNFFIVGAPKCGTTAWVEYLGTHPDIFLSHIKEPHYFASDLPRMRWTDSLEQYESLFDRAGDAAVVGEASVMYLYSTTAVDAIRDYNPHAKILIFLRDQEDFLPSLHHQYLYRFTESIEDFETAWRMSGDRPAETIPDLCRHPKLLDYKAIGRFSQQVERYLEAFPPEQIKIIGFRQWTSSPRSTYLEILDFLGVDDDGRTDFPRINEAKTHGNRWLGRLIHHPPPLLQLPIKLLRRITGLKRLGLGEMAAKLVASRGYRTSVSDELREEIRRYYEKDNAALEARLAQL